MDKYYQLARCFRDEDGRKDRQPEFTQIDIEMAFPSSDSGREVRAVVEGLIRRVWGDLGRGDVGEFKVMPYQVAMDVVR